MKLQGNLRSDPPSCCYWAWLWFQAPSPRCWLMMPAEDLTGVVIEHGCDSRPHLRDADLWCQRRIWQELLLSMVVIPGPISEMLTYDASGGFDRSKIRPDSWESGINGAIRKSISCYITYGHKEFINSPQDQAKNSRQLDDIHVMQQK